MKKQRITNYSLFKYTRVSLYELFHISLNRNFYYWNKITKNSQNKAKIK
jgi:hypothetical protein